MPATGRPEGAALSPLSLDPRGYECVEVFGHRVLLSAGDPR